MAFDGYTVAVGWDRTCDLSDKGRSLYPQGHLATSFLFIIDKSQGQEYRMCACYICSPLVCQTEVMLDLNGDPAGDPSTNTRDDSLQNDHVCRSLIG